MTQHCITDVCIAVSLTPIENDLIPAALSLRYECTAGVHESDKTATKMASERPRIAGAK